MNPSSQYKNHVKQMHGKQMHGKQMHIESKNKKSINIKNIQAFTPIPTAIKLKPPEPIQSNEDCSVFNYPILDTINTDFKQVSQTYNKVTICPYFVTTCKNRSGVYKPYIQYLLYKYPSEDKKYGNLLVFPFTIVRPNINVQVTADKLLKSVIKTKIAPKGFIQDNNTIFVFYDLSSVDEYSSIPRAEQQWLKLIKQSNNLWWVLIDEICNHRKSLNFPIHKSVTNLFYNNPILIYLKQNMKNIDIPIVAYYGNYYKFLPIISSLGQKPTAWPNLEFGPYFYFTSYTGAFRYAGWTSNYQQRNVYDRDISDEDGKLTKGGIIRFAVFMEKTDVLLDVRKNIIQKYINDTENEWAKRFNSLYIGKVPRVNNSVWYINPKLVVKKFEQQLPLSMHLVDMNSLKSTWDPLYNGNQIE